MKKYFLISALMITQSVLASDLKIKTVKFSTGAKYLDTNSTQYQINDILENLTYFTAKPTTGHIDCGQSIYFINEQNHLKLQIVRSNPITGELESAIIDENNVSTESMKQSFSEIDQREFFSLTMSLGDYQIIRCRYTKAPSELNQK